MGPGGRRTLTENGPTQAEVVEWCCVIYGSVIKEVMPILDRLNKLTGYSLPLADLRVQGGEHTPQAERRVELLERLDGYPPVLLGVARASRVVSHERAGYTPRHHRWFTWGMSAEEVETEPEEA